MTERRRQPIIEKTLGREVLVAFWKAHILHHAERGPIYGLWMIEELAEHGYRLSPGTLYPMLARMERNGWLRSQVGAKGNERKNYRITADGRRVLRELRKHVRELHHEVVLEAHTRHRSGAKSSGNH